MMVMAASYYIQGVAFIKYQMMMRKYPFLIVCSKSTAATWMRVNSSWLENNYY